MLVKTKNVEWECLSVTTNLKIFKIEHIFKNNDPFFLLSWISINPVQ